MSRKMQPVDTGEREKINKLKNEIKSDSGGKVEWLYSGNKVDRDAYLLGKPIDKLILEKDNEKEKDVPIVSTFDLANKIRDDPLFEIKKREIEAKKRLLENPLRIKQLQQMYAGNKNRSASDDDDDDEENSDDQKKSSSHKKHKKKHHHHHHHKEERKQQGDEESHSRKKKKKRSRSRSRSKSRSRSRSPQVREGYGLTKHSSSSNKHGSGGEVKSEKAREIEEYKQRINKLKDLKGSSSIGSAGSSGERPSTKKLSDEEKRRRLEEMQSNAKWRDDVRHKNISKFEADEKREKRLEEVSRSSRMQTEASNMFNNIMKDAYKSTEDRIRSNMYNIQRSKSSYESSSSFARK